MYEIHMILVLFAGMIVVANLYELKLDTKRKKELDERDPKKYQQKRTPAQKPAIKATTDKPALYFVRGKCWVIDGDDISVNGQRIRMAGIDAPEGDQIAEGWDGMMYESGDVVKRMLCKKIGGKRVKVRIEGTDRYGRKIGTVFLNGEDINRRMVRKGLAIAAYGDQYKEDESFAKKQRKGMWGDKVAYDPRYWKYGKHVPL